ncbi:hypothetical protein TRVL_07083 [Trypanosoma vivax]|nr:hypothetical protein TRVL_07083 [Trypanosoma vivax]
MHEMRRLQTEVKHGALHINAACKSSSHYTSCPGNAASRVAAVVGMPATQARRLPAHVRMICRSNARTRSVTVMHATTIYFDPQQRYHPLTRRYDKQSSRPLHARTWALPFSRHSTKKLCLLRDATRSARNALVALHTHDLGENEAAVAGDCATSRSRPHLSCYALLAPHATRSTPRCAGRECAVAQA